MKRSLGSTFVRNASLPLNEAVALLGQQRIDEALVLLDANRLIGAVRAAAGATARRASAATDRVSALLPWSDLQLIARLVDACRHEATSARSERKESDRPAGRSQPPSAFDAAERLRAMTRAAIGIAGTADAMSVLAAALDRYEGLLVEGGRRIDDSPGLRASYRWKWTRRLLAAAAVIAAFVWYWRNEAEIAASRARVESILASADACAAFGIASADMERAPPEAHERSEQRRHECEANRARAASEAEHRAKCEALSADVEKGVLSADDVAFAGEKAAIFKRIARGTLDGRDLELTPDALGHGCPDDSTRIWKVLIKNAPRASEAWASAEVISEPLEHALTASGGGISAESQKELALHAEAVAKRAASSSDPATIARAERLCELSRQFGSTWHGWCTGVAILYARTRHRAD